MNGAIVVAQENQGALVTLTDLEKMASYVVKSGLFGVKNTEQAVALMLIAQAEGMHPALAARDYHIIQGRHSLKADAMLARFQQAGGKVKWVDYTDHKVSAYFSHPSSPNEVFIEWDMARAKQADLGGKDNWKKYPRQMLRARVISEGVRSTYPGVAVGVYTPEEVQDFDDTPQRSTPQPRQKMSQVAHLKDKLMPQDKQESPAPEEPLFMDAEAEPVDATITEEQAKDIASQCKKAGIEYQQLLTAFGVTKFSQLRESQMNAVYDYILGVGKE